MLLGSLVNAGERLYMCHALLESRQFSLKHCYYTI